MLNGAAVLDKETGLVWEQSPSTRTFSWDFAQSHCNRLTTGGHLGWRLPAIQELTSLVDQTQSSPALPSGHPFLNVQSYPESVYWSATTVVGSTSIAWYVRFFGHGGVGTVADDYNKGFVWCVRGHGVDSQ